MSTQPRTFVIVGASLAGAKAAETLREEGLDGRLILIGEESERPYERPPLTKDYLRAESPREQGYVHPEAFYAEQDIELMTETTVTALDVSRSRVALDDGSDVCIDTPPHFAMPDQPWMQKCWVICSRDRTRVLPDEALHRSGRA